MTVIWDNRLQNKATGIEKKKKVCSLISFALEVL